MYSVVDLGAWRIGITLSKAAIGTPDVKYAVLGTAEATSTYCRQCEAVVADPSLERGARASGTRIAVCSWGI